VSNGSGVSRGDRNRNRKLTRVRELVPVRNAIAAIDLADGKQLLVVDHDSRVLARRTLGSRGSCPSAEPHPASTDSGRRVRSSRRRVRRRSRSEWP
jgi:hypothetical protein